MQNNLMTAADSTQNRNTLSQEDAELEANMQRMMRQYLYEKALVEKLDAKEAAYQRKLAGEAQNAAANEGILMGRIKNSPTRTLAPMTQAPPTQARKMRTTWDGPMPNRPVVNGIAQVSKEELADFRRKFGPQMTLRDLLNADRGVGPSAADPRARGMQGANTAPGMFDPYQDPSRLLEGVAAAQRAIAQPGRDAVEGFYPELAVIPATRMLMGAGRAAAPLTASAATAQPMRLAQISRDPRTGLPMRMMIP